jgi:AcrR family transcriptional regulator
VEPGFGPGQGRERILREARRLFAERGYAAVSMQQIADAAAVNKATLYHHVRDKEELFLAVVSEELTRSRDALAAAVADGTTLREQFRGVAAHVVSAHRSDVGRLMADLRHHVAPDRHRELFAANAPPWRGIAPAIERAIAAGEVRPVDPDLVARFLFAMATSQLWWTGPDPGEDPPLPDPAVAAAIADVLLDGIEEASA